MIILASRKNVDYAFTRNADGTCRVSINGVDLPMRDGRGDKVHAETEEAFRRAVHHWLIRADRADAMEASRIVRAETR